MSRKSSKKHVRRRARENALALLYSGDIVETDAERIVEEGSYPAGMHLTDFAESLVRGVSLHAAEIDERLEASSDNWTLDRMPVVDRAILRLAVYEMMYVDDVPVSVAINEAVELAKIYGGEDDSARFVNGVLGRIARALPSDESENSAEEPASADAEASVDAAAAGASPEVADVDHEGKASGSAAVEGEAAAEAPAVAGVADASPGPASDETVADEAVAGEVQPADPANSDSNCEGDE